MELINLLPNGNITLIMAGNLTLPLALRPVMDQIVIGSTGMMVYHF